MKLPSFRRLNKGDYEEKDRTLIEQIALSINPIIDSIVSTLNNKISFIDNLFCEIKEITVTPKEDGSVSGKFSVVNSGQVFGISVLKISSKDKLTGGVSLMYSQSGQLVEITQITGLSPQKTYTIKLAVYF